MSAQHTLPITRALYILPPFCDWIFDGSEYSKQVKSWEMRTGGTQVRGWIGIIKSGSNSIIGIARLVDSIGPLTSKTIISNAAKNHESADGIKQMFAAHAANPVTKLYNHAWILEDAVRLPHPIRITPKNGAVIFTDLEDYSVKSGIHKGESRQVLPPLSRKAFIEGIRAVRPDLTLK